MIDDWAWTYEKHPLSVSGTAGTTTWSKILFGAKTVSMTWSATPASSAGCTFRYRVESASLPKPAAATTRLKGSKAKTGSRSMTVKYGDGALTVTTDCAKYRVKIVSTGHPGLTIKQSNDPFKATGTTARELNEALAKSWADWGYTANTKYYTGATIRVSSFTVTDRIDYELPAWKAPEGTDPQLVEDWKVALRNMRRHIEGEAVIGIQACGRMLAASTKKTFGSRAALDNYRERLGDRWLEWARNKSTAYNEATDYGVTQGAYIE